MIAQAHITAWRAGAPWSTDAQVEQDLVLSRAVIEIFSEPLLASELAFRGGTALHKLFFDPPGRYSEDIDLVQVRPGPIGPVLKALRARLDHWLGEPSWKQTGGRVTFLYRFNSELPPVTRLRLKVEINTEEHLAVMGIAPKELAVASPWFSGRAEVATFTLAELLGTKLRALYQRKKGRDLFDLALAIDRGLVDAPDKVVACFLKYLEQAGDRVTRAQFEANLDEKSIDPAFIKDIAPLLGTGIVYDANAALGRVQEVLIRRVPGAPWRKRR